MSITMVALQVATLVALIWIGVGLKKQADLTTALIRQEHAVSTPYVDTDGFAHTVSTPYRENDLALAHKQDLWDAFQEFTPANPPSWYDPNQRP